MKELNLDEKFNDILYWLTVIDSILIKFLSVMFGLQAFAKGTEFASQRLYSSNSIKRSGKINPPIVIRPGDIIFGNLDGVVCIPRRLLDKVVENCKPVNTKIDARLKEK
ncbi:unnamed protein product [Rhizophagus irregularis]|nr:unnamed protein product [Rhizophagus irregularis]CAB4418016.1 unnamed protein product [Rhizophagus irregularis]